MPCRKYCSCCCACPSRACTLAPSRMPLPPYGIGSGAAGSSTAALAESSYSMSAAAGGLLSGPAGRKPTGGASQHTESSVPAVTTCIAHVREGLGVTCEGATGKVCTCIPNDGGARSNRYVASTSCSLVRDESTHVSNCRCTCAISARVQVTHPCACSAARNCALRPNLTPDGPAY